MLKKHFVRASVATSAPGKSRIEEINAQKSEKFQIGVLGASGYTGSEVASILSVLYLLISKGLLVVHCSELCFSNCNKHVFALLSLWSNIFQVIDP